MVLMMVKKVKSLKKDLVKKMKKINDQKSNFISIATIDGIVDNWPTIQSSDQCNVSDTHAGISL